MACNCITSLLIWNNDIVRSGKLHYLYFLKIQMSILGDFISKNTNNQVHSAFFSINQHLNNDETLEPNASISPRLFTLRLLVTSALCVFNSFIRWTDAEEDSI